MPDQIIALCENHDCAEHGARRRLDGFVEHGVIYLNDDDDAACPECGQACEVSRG